MRPRFGERLWERLRQAATRACAGTRWVNIEFRSLVLEPGFLLRVIRGRTVVARRQTEPGPSPRRAHHLRRSLDRRRRRTARGPSRTRGRLRPHATGTPLFQPGGRSCRSSKHSDRKPADVVIALAAMTSAAMRSIVLVAEPGTPLLSLSPACRSGRSSAPSFGCTSSSGSQAAAPVRSRAGASRSRLQGCGPDDPRTSRRKWGTLVAAAREQAFPSTTIQHGIDGRAQLGHTVVAGGRDGGLCGRAPERGHRERAPQTARFVVSGIPGSMAWLNAAPEIAAFCARRSTRPAVHHRHKSPAFVTEFSVCASNALNVTMIATKLRLGGQTAEVGRPVVKRCTRRKTRAYYAAAGMRPSAGIPPRLTVHEQTDSATTAPNRRMCSSPDIRGRHSNR